MSDIDIDSDDSYTDSSSIDNTSSIDDDGSEYESDSDSVESRVTDRSSCRGKIHTSKNVFKLYKESRERIIDTLVNNKNYEGLESLGINCGESELDIEKIYELSSNVYGKLVCNDIDCIWDHKNFNTIKNEFERDCDLILNPPTVMEGFVECMYCKSTKTINFQKQTRSADEGATTFIKCMNPACGKTSRTYA